MVRRPVPLSVRILRSLLVIAGGVVVGKVVQYASLDYLEDRIGFTPASLIALVPFVAGLFLLKSRYPRFFRF